MQREKVWMPAEIAGAGEGEQEACVGGVSHSRRNEQVGKSRTSKISILILALALLMALPALALPFTYQGRLVSGTSCGERRESRVILTI